MHECMTPPWFTVKPGIFSFPSLNVLHYSRFTSLYSRLYRCFENRTLTPLNPWGMEFVRFLTQQRSLNDFFISKNSFNYFSDCHGFIIVLFCLIKYSISCFLVCAVSDIYFGRNQVSRNLTKVISGLVENGEEMAEPDSRCTIRTLASMKISFFVKLERAPEKFYKKCTSPDIRLQSVMS